MEAICSVVERNRGALCGASSCVCTAEGGAALYAGLRRFIQKVRSHFHAVKRISNYRRREVMSNRGTSSNNLLVMIIRHANLDGVGNYLSLMRRYK